MNLTAYALYDSATTTYGRPFFLHSDNQALRAFGDLCQDKDHEVGAHPKDYSLVRLGMYNDQTGKLTDEVKEFLQNGVEAQAGANKQPIDEGNTRLVKGVK